jgi:hypothetical protein
VEAMKFNTKKSAAYLWSLGSFLFFVAIILFVFVYQPSSGTNTDKTNQIISDWALVSTIWRIETIAAVLLAVSSWYFATIRHSINWIFIAFAHITMIIMYASMLGSYPVATEFYSESPNLFPMVNETAVWVFGLSNLLFLTGMTGIYFTSEILSKWISWIGALISLIGAIGSLALFFDLVTFENLSIGGPLILLLYLLNTYLGLKLVND